jgi:hypothetical protein
VIRTRGTYNYEVLCVQAHSLGTLIALHVVTDMPKALPQVYSRLCAVGFTGNTSNFPVSCANACCRLRIATWASCGEPIRCGSSLLSHSEPAHRLRSMLPRNIDARGTTCVHFFLFTLHKLKYLFSGRPQAPNAPIRLNALTSDPTELEIIRQDSYRFHGRHVRRYSKRQ